jgi:hypothetical protein
MQRPQRLMQRPQRKCLLQDILISDLCGLRIVLCGLCVKLLLLVAAYVAGLRNAPAKELLVSRLIHLDQLRKEITNSLYSI